MNIILLLIAILPVYLLGLYIYKKDKEKESKQLLSKLFIFGILSCFLVIIPSLIIDIFFPPFEELNQIQLLFYVFIEIALVEEICKWIMVYKIAYNHKEFNHIYDAIVYSCFVALGFAAFENILYVTEYGIYAGLLRAVSAVPGHTCNAIIMGNYLGLSKISKINNNEKLAKKNLILSIIIPTITHGIYDYCLFTGNSLYIIIFIIYIIVLYIYSIRKIKNLSKIENNFINNIPNFCPNCGTKVIGKYCIKCGIDLLK